ncbi:MAG: hypothetical protein AB1705_11945 [Verrucomicrobiota bacterium]
MLSAKVLEHAGKTREFEVVSVSEELVKTWSGRDSWRSDEMLPKDLLARIHTETGCDAVLFSQVTGFKGYPPLMIGWKLSLVTVPQGQPVWVADEWFDAADERVVTAARRFEQGGLLPDSLRDGWAVLHSPSRFADFSLSALLGLLPAIQQNSAKVSPPRADTPDGVGANQLKLCLPAKEMKYGNQPESAAGPGPEDARRLPVDTPDDGLD